MLVSEMMSSQVTTCTPATDLARVAACMWEKDIGCVVVVDPTDRPIGVITDRDLCMAAFTRGCTLASALAASLVERPVVTCKPTDPVSSAAEAMGLHQVRRLPVVDDDGRLAGILTLGDIARGHQTNAIAGAALAMIATPRHLAPAAGPVGRVRKRERAA